MRNIIIALLVLAILPAAAEAQRSRAKKTVEPEKTEISLPIPQSELDFNSYIPEMKEEKPVTMELGVSSWSPSEFTRTTPAVTSGNQDFETGALPFISINRMAAITNSLPRVYSKLGLSFASLEKTVQVSRPGAVLQATQDMSLFSARIGAEYRARRFASDLIEPVASFSLLPTLGLASRSQVEGTVSTIGVPFELAAGANFSPSFLPAEALGVKKMSLGIGAQYLFGLVGGSKIDGLGAQGSLRVDL